MTRSLVALLMSGAMMSTAPTCAWALEMPGPGARDARVRSVDYDPLQVVKITGQYRTATQVLFGDAETILHVALGDTTAWDVAAEKNILFIKPKAAHGLTNLIVTTALPGGATRNYTFELSVGEPRPGAGLFVLRFRYPADLRAAASAAISAEEQALVAKITALKLERGTIEGKRNLAYAVQGAASLQPSEVSDNGRFTVLRFPGAQAIPAIYEVTPDGSESLVPFDVRGEFVVIHGVARQLRLRRGRDVLCIFNDAPSPYGATAGTNTASPDIERTPAGAPASGTAQPPGGPHE